MTIEGELTIEAEILLAACFAVNSDGAPETYFQYLPSPVNGRFVYLQRSKSRFLSRCGGMSSRQSIGNFT
jgi:hypothetical protein